MIELSKDDVEILLDALVVFMEEVEAEYEDIHDTINLYSRLVLHKRSLNA